MGYKRFGIETVMTILINRVYILKLLNISLLHNSKKIIMGKGKNKAFFIVGNIASCYISILYKNGIFAKTAKTAKKCHFSKISKKWVT